jgi:hypothetical protein
MGERSAHHVFKPWLAGAIALFSSVCRPADLTPTETRWLEGAWPVIAYAEQAKLPLDIVVQPQPTPGLAPLALGFVDGRCKLVLSMRGNPQAEAALERIEPALLGVTLELMAAHELGHCRRYLDGAWRGVPAGFAAAAPDALAPDQREAWLEMQATRREEGYGDLVGLAWTARENPEAYAALHAWLLRERSEGQTAGGHHDTLAWLRLAADARALQAPGLFDGAAVLWRAGLAGLAATH